MKVALARRHFTMMDLGAGLKTNTNGGENREG